MYFPCGILIFRIILLSKTLVIHRNLSDVVDQKQFEDDTVYIMLINHIRVTLGLFHGVKLKTET